jgi:membrane-bound inhibitor of C-type lysozyme
VNRHSGFARLVIVAGASLLMAGPVLAAEPAAEASFTCYAGKTIAATFYPDSVELKLSDGRSLILPQAMSGSGARYANTDESFVFWNKDDTAFITEGNPDKETYSGCVAK